MRQPHDKPNVILINCDDLGYADIEPYGSTVNDTPYLNRMAAEGVRFTDFYMAAPVCSPSRGAMMTGCYPRRIGFGQFEDKWVLFPGQGVGLSPDEVTVATLLRNQGYATRHIGKWHCGDQPAFLPTRHGFDGYFGLPYSNDMGVQSNRTDYPPLPLLRDEDVVQEQPDQASLTERYVEDAVRFIRTHRDEPFFLYFAHMYVHVPLFAPERFMRGSRHGRFGAAVGCVDWATGVLMHELARLGLEDNTLLIFTSDNGGAPRCGSINKPLRGGKGTTWEGGFRVPFLVRWPGQMPAGAECTALATSMDLLPTLAGLAGGAAPDDRIIDGRNIADLMRDPSGETPHEAFTYYFRDDLEAVRSGSWKLFVSRFDRREKRREAVRELYDLEADIGETTNVAEANPDVVKRLERLADAAREDLGDNAAGAEGANCRPVGRVENPVPLTAQDAAHPYLVPLYDLADQDKY